MTSEELMGTAYMKALGTPLPVGAKIHYEDDLIMITGYDFDFKTGLFAKTDSGKRLSDYDMLADGERRLMINRFYKAAKSGQRKECSYC